MHKPSAASLVSSSPAKRERKGTHCFFSNGEGEGLSAKSFFLTDPHLPRREERRVPFLSRERERTKRSNARCIKIEGGAC